MHQLMNAFKRQAEAQDNARPQPRWAVVMSVDPTRPAVKVMIQPEGVLTGWLPVLRASAGLTATAGVTPLPGWNAFIVPDAGDAESYVVVGFSHSTAAPPPSLPAANGTGGTKNTTAAAWVGGEGVMYAFGSIVRLCSDGSIFLQPGAGTVFIDGNLMCNGDVSDRHGSLDRLRAAYDAHKHTGVTTGSDKTGTTDHVDPE